MNPPHDAEKIRCLACQQLVETAQLRTVNEGTVMLCTCPHCGVVWGAWPLPLPLREEPTP
jgi:DNA-directed RNA polymerase subunit M/transcription elongation factor TFIIS